MRQKTTSTITVKAHKIQPNLMYMIDNIASFGPYNFVIFLGSAAQETESFIIQEICSHCNLFFAARACVCGSSFNHSFLYVKGESFQL